MVSSNSFQAKMVKIFGHLAEVIVYIDSILLFMKYGFNKHLHLIQQVLDLIEKNNLQVNIEKTFLASKKVDYLGYTLTTKGIMPQNVKILPILRLAPPTNKQDLRKFLGFVNY